jgi:hypothetical protein
LAAAIGQSHATIQRHAHFNIHNGTLMMKAAEKSPVNLLGLFGPIAKRNPNPCAAQLFKPLTRRTGVRVFYGSDDIANTSFN